MRRLATNVVVVAATILTFTIYADAFWRMECRSPSGFARVDPLISPGVPSGHAHLIFGSGGFSTTSDYDALRGGDCTSCSVAQDKSTYWHPGLYFKASNGEITAVNNVGGMLAYYLLYPNAGQTNVTAFPAGFQMIAGDTNQRNFTLPVPDPPKSEWPSDPAQSSQAALGQKALGFNCLNYDIAPEGSLYRHFLPNKAYLDANCKDGVRFELMFPSCWNGKDVTSHNFKDHVAYPDLVMTGNCPDDYPVRLVSLFYETIYDTYAFVGQDGEFVISNGDPTGYGYHGDFMMGWDEGFLQSAVDTCTNPSGEIEDCPIFTIQDADTYDACKFPLPDDLKTEDVQGPMENLPGNVQIQSGPAYATPGKAGAGGSAAASQVVPTLSHSAGSTVATGETYVPGAVFVVSSPSSASSTFSIASTSSTSAPSTPIPDPTSALPAGESIFSTMTTTMGDEVLELVMIEMLTTVYEPVTVTTMTTVAGIKRKRNWRVEHLKRHGHHGHGGLA